MQEKSFVVDVDKCTGCKLCVVACKDEHVDSAYEPWTKPQPEGGHFWADVIALERGAVPRVRMSFLPLFCQHCADAPCIRDCPEDAIEARPDGLVWIDPQACSGCGKCVESCPYDVIYMNADIGIAQKCTGCAHRVDENKTPRCADACPHDAIVFGNADELAEAARNAEPYHPEYGAKPRVRWNGLPKPWIAGLVLDGATDDVLIGASVEVSAKDQSRMTRSDEFGDFWIHGLAADEDYQVTVSAEGYEPVTMAVKTDKDRDVGTVVLRSKA